VDARRLRSLLGLAAIAVVATSCSLTGGDTANGGLGNTSWIVTSIGGQGTIADARPTMVFDPGGTVSGTNGCNTYSGRFATDGDKITIGQTASTAMGCEADRSAQESAFNAAFGAATTWKQAEDGTLHLTGGAEIVAVPAGAAPSSSAAGGTASLVDTSWTATSINGVAVGAIVPTLKFDPGTASGNSGCNTYNGTYRVDGKTIAFGPLISTKMACVGAGNDVESAFVAALQGASTWSIAGDGTLHLEGVAPIVLAPA
jgi:heat shock protein HslJ